MTVKRRLPARVAERVFEAFWRELNELHHSRRMVMPARDSLVVKAAYDALEQVLGPLLHAAWEEGYMRGRHPWESDSLIDPIPSWERPPAQGRNASPYRERR